MQSCTLNTENIIKYVLRAKRMVPKESLMTGDLTNFTSLAFFCASLRTRSGTWGKQWQADISDNCCRSQIYKANLNWQQSQQPQNTNQISIKTSQQSQSNCCLKHQFHVQRPTVRLDVTCPWWRLVHQNVLGFHSRDCYAVVRAARSRVQMSHLPTVRSQWNLVISPLIHSKPVLFELSN